jgi:hypothetical protein
MTVTPGMKIPEVESIAFDLASVLSTKNGLSDFGLQDNDLVCRQNYGIDSLAKPVKWVLQEYSPRGYGRMIGE